MTVYYNIVCYILVPVRKITRKSYSCCRLIAALVYRLHYYLLLTIYVLHCELFKTAFRLLLKGITNAPFSVQYKGIITRRGEGTILLLYYTENY